VRTRERASERRCAGGREAAGEDVMEGGGEGGGREAEERGSGHDSKALKSASLRLLSAAVRGLAPADRARQLVLIGRGNSSFLQDGNSSCTSSTGRRSSPFHQACSPLPASKTPPLAA
jgi:hypothetical protein